MKNQKVFLSLLLLVGGVSAGLTSFESQYVVAQSRSLSANIRLSSDIDNYAYNYALKLTHASVPAVGFSLSSLNSQMFPQYYLQLKVRSTEVNRTVVPILLRLPRIINEWRLIAFNILVSSNQNLEVGSNRLQTTALTDCTKMQSQTLTFSIQSQFDKRVTKPLCLLLNGWEVATKEMPDGTSSNFEISISDTYIEKSTVSLTVSRVTSTQINAVLFSYFVVKNQKTFTYDCDYTTIQNDSPNTIGLIVSQPSYDAIVFGISSLIYKQTFQERIDIMLSFNLNTNAISFITASKKSFSSANVAYLLIKETQVVPEPNKPENVLPSDMKCMPGCKSCTSFIDCKECEKGWALFNFICYPNNGNMINGKLQCNEGFTFNGNFCEPKSTVCAADEYRKDGACVKLPPNTLWNGYALVCKEGCYNNNGACVVMPEGTFWNGVALVCKEGFFNKSGTCSPLPLNAIWNGQEVACKDGFYFVNFMCLPMPSNAIWNGQTLTCKTGFYNNSGICTLLPLNTVWDGKTLACREGLYNRSGVCVPIPANSEWNGTAYVCKKGFYLQGECKPLPAFTEFVDGELRCVSGYKNNSGSCQPVTGKISIRYTGKAFFLGKVVLNIRVDGLPLSCPQDLLSKDFLIMRIMPEIAKDVPMITIRYVSGSRGAFTVSLDFKEMQNIPPFMIRTGISLAAQNAPSLATIDTSQVKQIRVETATMSLRDQISTLSI